MKSAYRVTAVFLFQIIAVLLLARVARLGDASLGRFGVTLWAALAFGAPSILAFFGFRHLVFPPFGGVRSRFLSIMFAAALASVGHLASIVTLARTDNWLTDRYIARTQSRLSADDRFSRFRLICCSKDYFLFPYIASGGSVSSEVDRKALLQFIQDSHPPVFFTPIVRIERRETSPNQEIGIPNHTAEPVSPSLAGSP